MFPVSVSHSPFRERPAKKGESRLVFISDVSVLLFIIVIIFKSGF